MPFLAPNQQRQSTEGTKALKAPVWPVKKENEVALQQAALDENGQVDGWH